MKRLLLLTSAFVLLLSTVSCDDDPTGTGGTGIPRARLSGHVTMLDDTVAVAGATVVLLEGVPYRVVAGPVTSRADGYFEFMNPPVGDWYLFVFANGRLMFDAADARVSIEPRARVTRDVEMIPSVFFGGGNRFITGRVTDAATGRPIAGASVSCFLQSVWHNFAGFMPDVETVTDVAGRYTVAPINLVLDIYLIRIIHPLGVSKEGYAPFYMMDVPGPVEPDSVYVLDIALERLGRAGTVRGRIVDENGPLANIPVALDFVGIPLDTLMGNNSKSGGDAPSRVPLQGAAVRTDTDGRFEILDLPPGTYWIDAAFLPDDGFVTAYDEDSVFEIKDNEVVETGDIRVLPALAPLAPANGAVVNEPQPILRWGGVAGADRYRLSAGAGHLLGFQRDITGATEYQFEEALPAGIHIRWTITAYRTATPYDQEIATFETIQTFTVGE